MGSERRDSIATSVVAGLIAIAIGAGASTARRRVPTVTGEREAAALAGAGARFNFFPPAGRIQVRSADSATRMDLELSVVIDDVERPLVMRNEDLRARDGGFVASFPLQVGGKPVQVRLELRIDPKEDTLSIALTTGPELPRDRVALRASLTRTTEAVFVPSHGELAAGAQVRAPSVVLDDGVHPIALLAGGDPIAIEQPTPAVPTTDPATRVVVTTAPRAGSGPAAELSVLVGPSAEGVWEHLYRALRVPTGVVQGFIAGTRDRARVVGLDEEGHPLVRAHVGADARFRVLAPTTAVFWHAAVDASTASAPVRFAPGTGVDVRLDVSPGGELRVVVRDEDTRRKLTSRLWIHGIDGTPDPSFGPDYRASGCGPLMDLLEGEVSTALPSGRYLVSATRGLEWSVDAMTVDVTGGRTRSVELSLRHVVPTAGLVGCDLHVHARPSFDSPVTPEDRVLSLVSAGVDFAVPTEHNLVGDYGPALEVTGLAPSLAWVPGVEVTTFKPKLGHFGVFPYPLKKPIPNFRTSSPASLFAQAHKGDPARVVQVNHPRLPNGIGYFSLMGWDGKTAAHLPPKLRLGFDTLEVYNGYDLGAPSRVEAVMRDWYALLDSGRRIPATGSSDSHRVQYHWAGYPRTYAAVTSRQAGEEGGELDVNAVVASIKAGRGFVTNGPIVHLEIDGAKPGDDAPRSSGRRPVKVRVLAAPWIDVSTVELVGTGGRVLWRADVASRPPRRGREEGPLEAAAARTVRLDAEATLDLGDTTWVIAVVRGARSMDDTLAFMTMTPLAFTNPIWLSR